MSNYYSMFLTNREHNLRTGWLFTSTGLRSTQQNSNWEPESNVSCWSASIREAWSPGFCHIWFVIGYAAVRIMQRVKHTVEAFFHPACWWRFTREVQYLPATRHSMVVTAWYLPPVPHCLSYSISFSLFLVDSLFVMNINIDWRLPDAQEWRRKEEEEEGA